MPPKPPLPLPSPSTYLTTAKTLLRSHPPKTLHDHLSPTPTRLLSQSLQPHLPPSLFPPITHPRPGSPLPLGNHLVYFPTPPLTLMPDGTDAHHCPSPPFTRRMWAGGSLSFAPRNKSLRMGDDAVCVESVDVERTEIKGIHPEQDHLTGDEKVFVYVNRKYGSPGMGSEEEPTIEEIRTLVFLSEKEILPPAPDKPTPRILLMPGPPPDLSFTLTPDARLLFHFSALSFNAHAIHLDRAYARDTEGYPDLLVQGPLLLCLMMKGIEAYIARRGDGLELRGLEYRNLRPVFVDGGVRVCVRGKKTGNGVRERDGEVVWDVWVEGPDGGLAVKGTARLGRRE